LSTVEDLKAMFNRGIDLEFINVLRDRIFNKDRAAFIIYIELRHRDKVE
jgi:hypothetical protein